MRVAVPHYVAAAAIAAAASFSVAYGARMNRNQARAGQKVPWGYGGGTSGAKAITPVNSDGSDATRSVKKAASRHYRSRRGPSDN